MESKEILTLAQSTLEIEAKALLDAKANLDEDFVSIVQLLASCKGRVVVTGVGKSAVIASKIVATFNSTGTPAIFMHAADAVHGDLGVLLKDDILLLISNSGNSPEIKALVPYVQKQGQTIIAIVGNKDSYLADSALYAIDSSVKTEVMEHIMAPTSSTTLQLALGDALAVCLMKIKNFTVEDFARNHPGGAIGKLIHLRVEDLLEKSVKPQVNVQASISEVIYEISSKRVGATAVFEDNRIVGVITDGDIRRMLQNNSNIQSLCAKDIMSKEPKTINANSLAKEAMQYLNKHNINQIIVKDSDSHYAGILHIHELIKEGIVA